MPKYETVRNVAHTPQQMFALVADIERYPEFLPMCEALSVRSRKQAHGVVVSIADMTVGYKAIRETFTSQVIAREADNAINVKYLDGPFRFLDNRWRFEPDGSGGTNINFYINYEFKSRILGAMMGAMFDRAFRMFAGAFEQRADQIYGAPLSASASQG